MEKDRRRQARQTTGERPAATLSLTVDGRPLSILGIHDITPLGIGLVVAGRVNNGAGATLSCRYGETDITVSGSIVWNLTGGAGSLESAIGICFDEKQAPLNMEFFNAFTA